MFPRVLKPAPSTGVVSYVPLTVKETRPGASPATLAAAVANGVALVLVNAAGKSSGAGFGQLVPGLPALGNTQVWPATPVINGWKAAISGLTSADRCHPVGRPVPMSEGRVSATVAEKEKVPLPTVAGVTAVNARELSALLVKVTPTLLLVLVAEPQGSTAKAAFVCPANAPAIIPTNMKVAASFRILRFFKIRIEKTFLVSTQCPDTTDA